MTVPTKTLDAFLNGDGGDAALLTRATDSTLIGEDVAVLDDLDGDGIRDFAVSSRFGAAGSPFSTAEVTIFSGAALSSLDGVDYDGAAMARFELGERARPVVEGLGDVNGDGRPDVGVVGPGVTYVLFGQEAGLSGVITPADLAAGAGLVFTHGDSEFFLEPPGGVAAADVDGDGAQDLLIGAPADGAGKLHVVFGGTGLGGALSEADLTGANGFTVVGAAAGDRLGEAVARAGDMNGDGVDDVVVGAPGRDSPGSGADAGAAYVVYGRSAAAFDATLAVDGASAAEVSELLGGASATGNNVLNRRWEVGASVAGGADLNGDGRDDLVLAAPGGVRALIVYGQEGGFGEATYLGLRRAIPGLLRNIVAPAENVSIAVDLVDDLDGDGLAEVLLGFATPVTDTGFPDDGGAYVVFSGASAPEADVFLAASSARDDAAFGIVGTPVSSVAGGGDVTGDGLPDFLFGLPFERFGTSLFPGGVVLVDFVGDDRPLIGTPGPDSLTGGADAEQIAALAGDDTVEGLGGDDTLLGGADDDALDGGAGSDSLVGGEGADALTDGPAGDPGADTLEGGAGADTLRSAGGADLLDGGADADLAVLDYAAATSAVRFDAEDLSGGAAEIEGIGARVRDVERFDVTTGSGDDRVSTGDGDDRIDLGGGAFNSADGRGGDDTLIGGDGDDNLIGGPGADLLRGGAGDDTFTATPGDEIDGGPGDRDRLSLSFLGETGAVTADIDAGGEIVIAFDGGADVTVRGVETFAIGGGDGDDVIRARTVEGSVNGRGGDDALEVRSSGFGGEGDDTITGSAAGGFLRGDGGHDVLRVLGGEWRLEGSDGDDEIDAAAASAVTVGGGDGSDTITGSGGSDEIDAGAGDDEIDAGAGGDTVDGGAGDDLLRGRGAGINTFYGDFTPSAAPGAPPVGDDTLIGGDERDFLFGQGGDDSLEGGDGDDQLFGAVLAGDMDADTLRGGAGDDILRGAAGRNLLDGGDGADLLELGAGDDSAEGGAGDDTIDSDGGLDLVDGGDGVDLYRLSDENALGNRRFDALSGQIRNVERLDIRTGAGDDTLIGGAGGDTLIGGDGEDSLVGGLGDDCLDGGDGNDTLIGGPGDDTLIGGDGDDFIDAGGGRDLIVGGRGQDVLRLKITPDFVAPTIQGTFSIVLDLGEFTPPADRPLIVDRQGLPVRPGEPVDFILPPDAEPTIVALDFRDVITGSDGDDTILAGGDDDSINGAAGDDEIRGQAGADTLAGGPGDDLLMGGDFRTNGDGSDGDEALFTSSVPADGIATTLGPPDEFQSLRVDVSQRPRDVAILDPDSIVRDETGAVIAGDFVSEGVDELVGIDLIRFRGAAQPAGGAGAAGDLVFELLFDGGGVEAPVLAQSDAFTGRLPGAGVDPVGVALFERDAAAGVLVNDFNLDEDAASGDVERVVGAGLQGDPAATALPEGGELVVQGALGALTIGADGAVAYRLTADADAVAALGLDPDDPARTLDRFFYLVDDGGDRPARAEIVVSALGAAPGDAWGSLDEPQALTLSVTADAAEIREATGAARPLTYSFTLSEPAATEVIVDYVLEVDQLAFGRARAADFVDGTPLSGAVTIPAGAASASLTVEIAGDAVAEQDEIIPLSVLARTARPDLARVEGPDATPVVTILDDDLPGAPGGRETVEITAAGPAEIAEGTGDATVAPFTLTLAAPAPAEVVIDWEIRGLAPEDLGPGQAASGQAVIAAGESAATVEIAVAADRIVEADATLVFEATSATTAPDIVVIPPAAPVETVVRDDDVARIVVDAERFAEGTSATSAGAPRDVRVSLDAPVEAAVRFDLALVDLTTDAADFASGQPLTGAVSFAPGETEAVVSVTIAPDGDIEADERFEIALDGAQAEGLEDRVEGGRGVQTIVNDDEGLRLGLSSPGVVPEGTGADGAAEFELFLTTPDGSRLAASDADIRVSWRILPGGVGAVDAIDPADLSDPDALSGEITIPAGQSRVTLPIGVRADDLAERDEGFTLLLSALAAAGRDVRFANQSASVIIDDDDGVTVSVAAADAVVREGAEGAENAVDYVFQRTGDLTREVSVDWAVDTELGAPFRAPRFLVTVFQDQTGEITGTTRTFLRMEDVEDATTFTAEFGAPAIQRSEQRLTGNFRVEEIEETFDVGLPTEPIPLFPLALSRQDEFVIGGLLGVDYGIDFEAGLRINPREAELGGFTWGTSNPITLFTPNFVQAGEGFTIAADREAASQTQTFAAAGYEIGELAFEFFAEFGDDNFIDFFDAATDESLGEFVLPPGALEPIEIAKIDQEGKEVPIDLQDILKLPDNPLFEPPELNLEFAIPDGLEIGRGYAGVDGELRPQPFVTPIATLNFSVFEALSFLPVIGVIDTFNDDLISLPKEPEEGQEDDQNAILRELQATLTTTLLDWNIGGGLGLVQEFVLNPGDIDFDVIVDGQEFDALFSTPEQGGGPRFTAPDSGVFEGAFRFRQRGDIDVNYRLSPVGKHEWEFLKLEASVKASDRVKQAVEAGGAVADALLGVDLDIPDLELKFEEGPVLSGPGDLDEAFELLQGFEYFAGSLTDVELGELIVPFSIPVVQDVDTALAGRVTFAAGEDEIVLSLPLLTDDDPEVEVDATIRITDVETGGIPFEIVSDAATTRVADDDVEFEEFRTQRVVSPPRSTNPLARTNGDPHLVTFDQLAFDLQSVGEFVAVRADGDNPFEVQFRTVAFGDFVSITGAVAVRVGESVVNFDPFGDGEFYLDGELVPRSFPGVPVDIDGGVLVPNRGAGGFIATATGDIVRFNGRGAFISLADERRGAVEGVFGDFDGDPFNDIRDADGRVLTTDARPSFDVLYGDFVSSWRVEDDPNGRNPSLFLYEDGKGTADFTDLGFPQSIVGLLDLPEAVVDEAERVVNGAPTAPPAPDTGVAPPAPAAAAPATRALAQPFAAQPFAAQSFALQPVAAEAAGPVSLASAPAAPAGFSAAAAAPETRLGGFDFASDQLRREAIYDFALTGDMRFVEDALEADILTAAASGPAPVVVEVTDAPALPAAVGARLLSAEATEAEAAAFGVAFQFYRVGPDGAPAAVDWRLGGEIDAADLAPGQALSGRVTLAPGQETAILVVETADDATPEGDETLTLALSRSEDAPSALIVDRAEVRLLNDDGALPATFVAEPLRAAADEGAPGDGGVLRYRVERTGDLSAAQTLALEIVPGTASADDFADGALERTLAFAPGERAKTVEIAVAGDLRDEADETFDLRVVAPDGVIALPGVIRDDDDAPTARDDAAETTAGEPVTIDALANDGAPGVALAPGSIRIESAPGAGTVAVEPAGGLVYTPADGAFGEDAFTYSVADAAGVRSAPARVSVRVAPRPTERSALRAVDDLFAVAAARPSMLALTANDRAAPGALLSIVAVTQPEAGRVEIMADGAVRFEPAAPAGAETEVAVFGYTVTDGLSQDNGQVVVAVAGAAAADAPVEPAPGDPGPAPLEQDPTPPDPEPGEPRPVDPVERDPADPAPAPQPGAGPAATSGDDLIFASPGDDVIDALAGDDTVKARAGDDDVTLGDGDDLALGGPGADTLRGGDGADTVKGGPGRDLVDGGADADVAYAGDGADTARGGAGEDILKGGLGDDVLDGGEDADVLFGFRGDDALDGGAGADRLLAGLDDDVLRGGPGDDRLRGAPGRDRFVFDTPDFGRDRIALDFRIGSDVIDFRGSGIDADDLQLAQAGGNVAISVADADDVSIVVGSPRLGGLAVEDFVQAFDAVFLFDM